MSVAILRFVTARATSPCAVALFIFEINGKYVRERFPLVDGGALGLYSYLTQFFFSICL